MMGRLFRFGLVFTGLLALFAGLWAGLIRMGWEFPPLAPNLPMLHGPLMVNGVLGVLIGLERAVALSSHGQRERLWWPYLSPPGIVLGIALLFVDSGIGILLITIGSLILVAANGVIIRRQPTLFTLTMGVGAASWLVGNVLWLTGQPIYQVVLWWLAFPLFTIIGERLELSRLLRLTRTSLVLFGIACILFLAGALLSLWSLDAGMRLAGIGELACALWLFRYDIARRTVKKPGLTRFIALCLLSGYGWLGISGLLNLWQGAAFAGPFYDAALHSVFVGFVFSMIFGHALIILPAVLQLGVAFDKKLYGALLLLHGSLLLRVMGDLALLPELRQWGGMFNVIALLLFLALVIRGVRAARRTQRITSDSSTQRAAAQ